MFRCPAPLRVAMLIAGVGALAPAEVVILGNPEVLSRGECTLRAQAEGGDRVWRWSFRGPEKPRQGLRPTLPDEARFTAPPTRTGEWVTVVVEDEGDPETRAELHIQVVPDPRQDPTPRAVVNRRGQVLAACSADRTIWKFDPSGHGALHARIPAAGDGVLSLRLLDAGELQVEDGTATWRVTSTGNVLPEPGPEAWADTPPPARRSPRQAKLERFRELQLRMRQAKKAQRQGQRPGAREAPRACLPPSGPSRKGLFLLTLAGLGALSHPGILGQETPLFNRFTGDATTALGRLGPFCAEALRAGRPLAPCAAGYREGLLEQVWGIQAQMEHLFVDPSVLGAGFCLANETQVEGKERVALAIGDTLARYDGLGADAAVLAYQLARDGYLLETAGSSLLAAQAATLPTSGGPSSPAALPSFLLGEAGNALNGGGTLVLGASAIYAKVAYLTAAYRARYQRWTSFQVGEVLNCTGRAPDPASPLPAPEALPAMGDTLVKMAAGCGMAELRGLSLPVCSPDAFTEFGQRNGTLTNLYQSIHCLYSGVLEGRQATCPHAPVSDSSGRTEAFSYFLEFSGEVFAAAYDAIVFGEGLFAAASELTLLGNAALRAGNATQARDLITGARSLTATGDALVANANELQRIGSLARRWMADLTLKFNAESRADLDEKEAASRTPAPSTAEPSVSSSTAVPSSSSTAIPAPSSTGTSFSSSTAITSGLAPTSTAPGTASDSEGDPTRFAPLSSTGEDTGAGLWPPHTSAAPRAASPFPLWPKPAARGEL